LSLHFTYPPLTMSQYRQQNPFMTAEAQHASDKVLQECAQVNEQFERLHIGSVAREVTREADAHSNGQYPRQEEAANPYLDPALARAQQEFAPEANAEFEAQHQVAADSQPQPAVENPYQRHIFYKHEEEQSQSPSQEHAEELEAFISKFEAECADEVGRAKDEKVASDGDECDSEPPRRSSVDCIEGCEAITPANFGSLRAGDMVSMLMDNLWTYYRVVRLEENGGALVAQFESGFASAHPEESVFIKHGAIRRFVTVWAEQAAAEYTICREFQGTADTETTQLKPAPNAWVKLQHDGKLYLVLSYEESTGMATLKGIGQSDEKRVNLDVCAHKVL